MKINFNYQLTSLSGEAFVGDTNHAGKILANAISVNNKGNAIKLYDWALKLWNKEPLELDDTDFNVLYAFIESTELLNILCKAQMIKSMDTDKKK